MSETTTGNAWVVKTSEIIPDGERRYADADVVLLRAERMVRDVAMKLRGEHPGGNVILTVSARPWDAPAPVVGPVTYEKVTVVERGHIESSYEGQWIVRDPEDEGVGLQSLAPDAALVGVGRFEVVIKFTPEEK